MLQARKDDGLRNPRSSLGRRLLVVLDVLCKRVGERESVLQALGKLGDLRVSLLAGWGGIK